MKTNRDASVELSPQLLLRAYAMGIFPMSDDASNPNVFWVEPECRGVFPLDALHISRSLRKFIRQDRFIVTANTAFDDVISACADVTQNRSSTWINNTIFNACRDLHRLGYAHSIECWAKNKLIGGLYGISLNGAFFGESMFSRASNASKVALVHLAARLLSGGFKLLDTQFITPHLTALGAIEISKTAYQTKLSEAMQSTADFHALPQSITGRLAIELTAPQLKVSNLEPKHHIQDD